MKPMFMMMVGLPYSGKSCYAEKLKEEFNAVVHWQKCHLRRNEYQL